MGVALRFIRERGFEMSNKLENVFALRVSSLKYSQMDCGVNKDW